MKLIRHFLLTAGVSLFVLLVAYAAGFWVFLRPYGGLYRLEEDSFERVLVYELRDTVPNRTLCAIYSPVIYCLDARVEWH